MSSKARVKKIKKSADREPSVRWSKTNPEQVRIEGETSSSRSEDTSSAPPPRPANVNVDVANNAAAREAIKPAVMEIAPIEPRALLEEAALPNAIPHEPTAEEQRAIREAEKSRAHYYYIKYENGVPKVVIETPESKQKQQKDIERMQKNQKQAAIAAAKKPSLLRRIQNTVTSLFCPCRRCIR